MSYLEYQNGYYDHTHGFLLRSTYFQTEIISRVNTTLSNLGLTFSVDFPQNYFFVGLVDRMLLQNFSKYFKDVADLRIIVRRWQIGLDISVQSGLEFWFRIFNNHFYYPHKIPFSLQNQVVEYNLGDEVINVEYVSMMLLKLNQYESHLYFPHLKPTLWFSGIASDVAGTSFYYKIDNQSDPENLLITFSQNQFDLFTDFMYFTMFALTENSIDATKNNIYNYIHHVNINKLTDAEIQSRYKDDGGQNYCLHQNYFTQQRKLISRRIIDQMIREKSSCRKDMSLAELDRYLKKEKKTIFREYYKYFTKFKNEDCRLADPYAENFKKKRRKRRSLSRRRRYEYSYDEDWV